MYRSISLVALENKKFVINWYYDDNDILDVGESFSSILDIPFNFIRIS
ncbi:MAG: DUF1987 domain-containing protein [Bacteroidales bacterium]|nr:DUF1987 domain-containing protein [Bacteroidales bacterium]